MFSRANVYFYSEDFYYNIGVLGLAKAHQLATHDGCWCFHCSIPLLPTPSQPTTRQVLSSDSSSTVSTSIKVLRCRYQPPNTRVRDPLVMCIALLARAMLGPYLMVLELKSMTLIVLLPAAVPPAMMTWLPTVAQLGCQALEVRRDGQVSYRSFSTQHWCHTPGHWCLLWPGSWRREHRHRGGPWPPAQGWTMGTGTGVDHGHRQCRTLAPHSAARSQEGASVHVAVWAVCVRASMKPSQYVDPMARQSDRCSVGSIVWQVPNHPLHPGSLQGEAAFGEETVICTSAVDN